VIDPLVSLAFAIYGNRGGYALLLGSGISRAAGVPTGWEVVLDLIERVRQVEGEVGNESSEDWYWSRFNSEPDYAVLLEAIAREPAERQRLLRRYFEPSTQEREEGLKLPTAAHRAIARLVQGGFVRVIITTNFDRLLEDALGEVGIVPTVIATADAVAGAPPLAHSQCVIVKVHGDYIDTRIRNTPTELDSYDPLLDRLLDQIFDEYGLVICGWSAEWDVALRDAIARCPTRRFTTFWTSRGELARAARDLANARRAEVIPIKDAEGFFSALEEKVAALEELDAPHPLSTRLAVVTLKRYLADDRYRIRLHDLFHDEVARLEEQTTLTRMPVGGITMNRDEYLQRLGRYEAISEPLVALMATGAYWSDQEQRELLISILDRLASRWTEPMGGIGTLLELLDYPTVLALYGAGLGAVAGNQLETLAHLLGRLEVRRHGERIAFPLEMAVARVVDEGPLQPVSGNPRHYTPASDRLAEVLREPLRELIPNDGRFLEIFDRFEYLFSLAFADLSGRSGGPMWAPVGSFAWRNRRVRDGSLYQGVAEEVGREGGDWPFLHGPLFEQSSGRFMEVKAAVDDSVARLPWL
jgi:hypothetical protein